MEEVVTYTEIQRHNYDPTHTTALRNSFAKAMKVRVVELKRVIREALLEQDCFGLDKYKIIINQMTPPGSGAFNYLRDPDKVDAFMRWLRQQVDKGVLSVGTFQQLGMSMEQAWTNLYILDSYKRGIIRARAELKKAGFPISSLEEAGGIDAILNGTPFHIDRVGLLYTRVFSDLNGITNAMDSMISRILAQGMIDGDNPTLLARKLIASIDGTDLGKLSLTDTLGRFIPAERRAMMLARTEIIRAFHLASIQEYRNWGLEDVYVKAEWVTAGDDRVCEKCASLEGKIFTLDEIEPLIPYHPYCRCIALPYIEDIVKYYK
jgi:SPP1 gp7 family putative phage head morphogenesis protein